jgi:hypothetical protein
MTTIKITLHLDNKITINTGKKLELYENFLFK